jgi:hypothetical protein
MMIRSSSDLVLAVEYRNSREATGSERQAVWCPRPADHGS